MKIFPVEAEAAIARGDAITSAAAEILCDPPVRVWAGFEPRMIDGELHQPIGNAGFIAQSGGSIGGSEQNITLELSGVEPEVLATFDATALRRAPAIVRRLIFDSSGTQMLHAFAASRGRLDQIPVEETPGGTATIKAMVETAARGLGRRGGRMRTDADQRLIKANDGGFKAVAYAGLKNLYWGGKLPATAASALGGRPVKTSPIPGFF